MNDHPPAPGTLEPIFCPRSVAVIGASRKRNSLSWALLHNLVMRQVEGAIYPVNPHARFVHSIKAYASLAAIPDEIDLAVVMVPAKLVESVIDECLEKRVGGIVVISAGFSETGLAGAAAEARIRDKVRAAGVRLVGPNCMGVINTDPRYSLDASFTPTPAQHGSIGFVSQSGALGVAILNVAADLGIGLTQFVSMGNKADVSGNDLLEHWENDPDTRVIAMYLESFGNPRRFTEIAKRISRKKPILVVKAGRTAAGARAASSHTGALAGADITVSTFLDQCGVLRANTIEELFDVALALDRCPPPAGRRVAIVTNAGGPAIMATDACVNQGLEIADLAEATREALRAFLPPEASLGNPVDMIASATAESYARTLSAVLADPGVDMVMVINVTPLLSNPIDILEASAQTARSVAEKPLLAVMMATDDFYAEIKGRSDLPPVYRFPEAAARALAQLHRYSAWRERPIDPSPVFEVDDDAVAEILAPTAGGYLPPADAFRILELYGIPLVPWRVVAAEEEATAAAAAIGYPLAAKAIASQLVHKSDVGAVALAIESPLELTDRLAEMRHVLAAAGHQVEGWLLQRMAVGGHEVIFGIDTDPRYGPLLMFGLGGRYVEVFRDVRFAITPLAPSEAEEVIRGINGFRLLEGVRGERAADLSVLTDVLLRLGQLADRHPAIQELDINPFLAAPDREQAMALDVRIRCRAR